MTPAEQITALEDEVQRLRTHMRITEDELMATRERCEEALAAAAEAEADRDQAAVAERRRVADEVADYGREYAYVGRDKQNYVPLRGLVNRILEPIGLALAADDIATRSLHYEEIDFDGCCHYCPECTGHPFRHANVVPWPCAISLAWVEDRDK